MKVLLHETDIPANLSDMHTFVISTNAYVRGSPVVESGVEIEIVGISLEAHGLIEAEFGKLPFMDRTPEESTAQYMHAGVSQLLQKISARIAAISAHADMPAELIFCRRIQLQKIGCDIGFGGGVSGTRLMIFSHPYKTEEQARAIVQEMGNAIFPQKNHPIQVGFRGQEEPTDQEE